MKKIVGRVFEPLMFALLLGTAGLMALSPSWRRLYRNFLALHPAEASLVTVLRACSNQVSQAIPLVLPSVLLLGALPGLLIKNPVAVVLGVCVAAAGWVVAPIAFAASEDLAEIERILSTKSVDKAGDGSQRGQ